MSAASYMRGRTGAMKRIARELADCQDAHRATSKKLNDTEDKLSAIETEMVVLRKLLPGGEWFVKLGLDYHPYPSETDYRESKRRHPSHPESHRLADPSRLGEKDSDPAP